MFSHRCAHVTPFLFCHMSPVTCDMGSLKMLQFHTVIFWFYDFTIDKIMIRDFHMWPRVEGVTCKNPHSLYTDMEESLDTFLDVGVCRNRWGHSRIQIYGRSDPEYWDSVKFQWVSLKLSQHFQMCYNLILATQVQWWLCMICNWLSWELTPNSGQFRSTWFDFEFCWNIVQNAARAWVVLSLLGNLQCGLCCTSWSSLLILDFSFNPSDLTL